MPVAAAPSASPVPARLLPADCGGVGCCCRLGLLSDSVHRPLKYLLSLCAWVDWLRAEASGNTARVLSVAAQQVPGKGRGRQLPLHPTAKCC